MMKSNENGNILVTSLLILLVMSLMGAGMIQMSVRESKTATFKAVDSEVFHIAESCSRSAIDWMESQTSPPANMPYVITANNLDSMLTGNETQSELNKLAGYSYTCTMTELIGKAATGGSGSGEEVAGDSGSYGTGGTANLKYYYQIESNSSGPQNSAKKIYTIISVEF